MANITSEVEDIKVISSPWPSKFRRDLLFQKLFEGDDDSKLDGMNEISAWKARTFPRIPLGIEVTTDLIRALLYDKKVLANGKQQGGVGTLHRDCVAHMLSMAVIRFVNLVTEVGQDAGYSKHILGISEKMGVPEWIVDLRHSASHAALPELNVLKTAVEWALQWVKINYWQLEDSLLSDVESISTAHSRKKTETSMFKFRNLVYGKMARKEKPVAQIYAKNKVPLIQIPPKESRALWKKTVVDILVHDGYLIPRSTHLSMLLAKSGPGPEGIFQTLSIAWRQLLDELVDLKLTWPIVAALAESLPGLSGLETELCLRWMAILMELTKDSSKVKMRQRMNWPRICKLVITSPAEFASINRVLRLVKHEHRVPNLGTMTKFVANKSPGTLKLLQQSWLKQDQTKKVTTNQSTEATAHNHQHNDHRFVPVSAEELESVWSGCPLGVLPNELGNPEFHLEFPAAVNLVNAGVSESNAMGHFFGNCKRVTTFDNSKQSDEGTHTIVAEIFDDHPTLV